MANERTTRDDGKDGEVQRLRDIVVEEVSLVDRAANKRRFLVVKRSAPMANKNEGGAGAATRSRTAKGRTSDDETEEDGKKPRRRTAGTADDDKEKKKAQETEDDAEEEETEKAAHPDAEEDEEDEEDEEEETEKAASSEEEQDEEEEEEETEKAADPDDEGEEEEEEDGATKKKAAGGDDEEEDEEGGAKRRKRKAVALTREAKAKVLGQLTEGLERLMAVAKAVSAAEESGDTSKTGLPESLSTELFAVGELVGKAAGTAQAVSKGGARMARSRLDRFQKAVALLADILKELTDAKEEAPGGKAGLFAKGEKPGALTETLAELSRGMGELTKVVKGQQEELTRIRKTRGVSNAIAVDGTGRRSDAQDVSWPLDMNRPITRDSVNKATSFFDD